MFAIAALALIATVRALSPRDRMSELLKSLRTTHGGPSFVSRSALRRVHGRFLAWTMDLETEVPWCFRVQLSE